MIVARQRREHGGEREGGRGGHIYVRTLFAAVSVCRCVSKNGGEGGGRGGGRPNARFTRVCVRSEYDKGIEALRKQMACRFFVTRQEERGEGELERKRLFRFCRGPRLFARRLSSLSPSLSLSLWVLVVLDSG